MKRIRLDINHLFYLTPILIMLVPFIAPSRYVLHVFTMIFIFSSLAVGYDLLDGYLGQLNFGYAAFFAIGAYVSALLTNRGILSPWSGLIVGGAFASLVGALVSFPCSKLRGKAYVAIVTWGFAAILQQILANWVEVTRGYLGLWEIPPFPPISLGGLGTIDFTVSKAGSFYLMLLILVSVTLASRYIVKSRIGLIFKSIREDEIAAQAMGIDVTKQKVLGFAISSFIAGLTGSFYAHYMRVLTPDVSDITYTIEVIAFVMIGGKATLVGPILGCFFLTFISEITRPLLQLRLVLYGAAIVVSVLFLHGGLMSIRKYVMGGEKKH